MDFPVAQMVKNLPAMQEMQVQSLCGEDPLEKGMATHFSILAWRIPWTEEPGGLQSMGSQRVGHNWATNTTTTKLSATARIIVQLYVENGSFSMRRLRIWHKQIHDELEKKPWQLVNSLCMSINLCPAHRPSGGGEGKVWLIRDHRLTRQGVHTGKFSRDL